MWYYGSGGLLIGYLVAMAYYLLLLPAHMLKKSNTPESLYWKLFGRNGHLKAYIIVFLLAMACAFLEQFKSFGEVIVWFLNPLHWIAIIIAIPVVFAFGAIGGSFPVCLILYAIDMLYRHFSKNTLRSDANKVKKEIMGWIDVLAEQIYTPKEKTEEKLPE